MKLRESISFFDKFISKLLTCSHLGSKQKYFSIKSPFNWITTIEAMGIEFEQLTNIESFFHANIKDWIAQLQKRFSPFSLFFIPWFFYSIWSFQDLYHVHILTFKFSELTESKAKVWFGWKEWSGNGYNRYKPIWINWWDLRQWNSKVFISSLDPISPNMAWWELLKRMDLNYSRSNFSKLCYVLRLFLLFYCVCCDMNYIKPLGHALLWIWL